MCLGLTGCLGFLKPAVSTARCYVLTPVPNGKPGTVMSEGKEAIGVGVGQVKVPAYLLGGMMAMRKGTNEVEYLPSVLWAGRVDSGLQQVIAANLSALLPTERVYLSAWRREDVAAEVYVVVEQFDFDAAGKGVLSARWRVISPGGELILRAGRSWLEREGPAPESDPAGAVAMLSGLVADLSGELANAIKESSSR